jgi:hypothetical protein
VQWLSKAAGTGEGGLAIINQGSDAVANALSGRAGVDSIALNPGFSGTCRPQMTQAF